MELPQAAGVLVRISDDRIGDEKGVIRQEADCRQLADRCGWKVAEVYVENDTSAYRRRTVVRPDGTTGLRVVRPEYRRLLHDVSAGRLDGLIAYDLDRVARDPRDLEDLIDIVEARSLPTASVTGSLDLSTDGGVFMARMMVNVANKSSRDTARRVRRKLEENAHEGRHHGGSRPYGWSDDRRTLHEEEAAFVRHAAAMLLGGNSMKAVVRALNEAGSRNSLGGLWRDVTLRNTLLRARNAGLRSHHGQLLDGVVGAWEPILDRDSWEQVRLVLTDPSRRTNPGATGRTHLLSGIARCGVCGGPLRAAKGKPYKGVAATIYRCFPTGCVSRGQEPLDALVRALVCARLSRADAADLLRHDDEPADAAAARAEVERLHGRLQLAAADHDEDRITREQFLATTARLRTRLADAERRVPAPTPRLAVLDTLVTQDDVQAAWDVLDVSVRRQVVALLLDIAVEPTRRGPGFRPESIKTAWRDDRDPLRREASEVG
jgi:site-specific DNA recombinase